MRPTSGQTSSQTGCARRRGELGTLDAGPKRKKSRVRTSNGPPPRVLARIRCKRVPTCTLTRAGYKGPLVAGDGREGLHGRGTMPGGPSRYIKMNLLHLYGGVGKPHPKPSSPSDKVPSVGRSRAFNFGVKTPTLAAGSPFHAKLTGRSSFSTLHRQVSLRIVESPLEVQSCACSGPG